MGGFEAYHAGMVVVVRWCLMVVRAIDDIQNNPTDRNHGQTDYQRPQTTPQSYDCGHHPDEPSGG